jgi:primosomal protein N' (replication factor Y) (superfamily II helicase)
MSVANQNTTTEFDANMHTDVVYAEVVIPLALPINFTWKIPALFVQQAQPGIRVEVTLRSKKYAGIIKRLHHEKPEAFEPKYILSVLDDEPIIFQRQLDLWQWIARYYMCTEGEVMNAAIPAHFKLSSESILVYNEDYGEDFSQLGHDEYLVAEALLIRKQLKMNEVQAILDNARVYTVVKNLAQKKVCHIWESLKERYSSKTETFIVLHPKYAAEKELEALLNNWEKAPGQMELLLAYLHLQRQNTQVTKKELLTKAGATDAKLKGLLEKKILIAEKRPVDRLPRLPENILIDFEPSPAQQKALQEIETAFEKHPVCLLHGITGSGKTELYIKLIEAVLKEGKQTLYLLPEIALTAQLIRRLQKHFGGYIAVYHSKFSENERIEIWNRVKSGSAKIVLGVRSALFLPYTDLRLIVVDEEHEPSFKQQDPAPRYHARDTAIYYASRCGAKVLLGSATPSAESYYNAEQKKYALVTLTERYGGMALPEITIVDTRPFQKNQSEKQIITPPLQEAMQECLDAHRQVILFKNRRGYTPCKVCVTCGWIPQCSQCDVALTFHKQRNQLVCHYCGNTYPVVDTCQACGNHQFQQKNFGTEKIAETTETLFPKAIVARMDVDTVRGKTAHTQLVQQFEQGRIDILVGTQMVVKGLDFDKVDLVGIPDGDSLLHYADFRVHERAFQLIEQVSGRAGRREVRGKVILQLAHVQHPILQYVLKHDFAGFFNAEMEARKQFFYPPFSRLIKLEFRHPVKEVVEHAAVTFATNLSKEMGRYMVGPAEPVVNRVKNRYLSELLFKLPKDAAMINKCKTGIQRETARLQQDKTFRSVVIIPDVDPV